MSPGWYSAEARLPFSRAIVQRYRSVLESAGLAPASINLRLSAIRKLAAEAADNGLLDRSLAQGIVSLKGVRQSGDKAGNWLPPGTLDKAAHIKTRTSRLVAKCEDR